MRWYLGFCAYSSLGWTPSPTNSCIEDNMYHHVQMLVLGALDVIIADVSARHGSPICLSSIYISTHISTTKSRGFLTVDGSFFPIPNYLFWMFYIEILVFFYNGDCQPTKLPSSGGRTLQWRKARSGGWNFPPDGEEARHGNYVQKRMRRKW